MKCWVATFAFLLLGTSGHALELAFPSNAKQLAERDTSPDSFDAPIGVFVDGAVPTQLIEGAVNRSAWRIPSQGVTTLQIMAPLRAQIKASGFDVVFECETNTCGGFDFRFAVETLPAPNMYVNIRDYRYLTALLGPEDAPTEAIALLVSATSSAVFVQEIQTAAGDPVTYTVQAQTEPVVSSSAQGNQPDLIKNGHVVLGDVDFASGKSQLAAGPFASLERVAQTLVARPKLRIALVGHTDSVGGLSANIALSKRRAQAVRDRLVQAYDIASHRLEAEGNGYLSPVASNLTPEGREANRRVEAIVLSEE
ncbi:MAG: OmpA family protein [Sulfitobacter sp.]